ncbi:MAG: hypothetical protein ABFC62_08245, partial [Clostridiaceae bacterium]
TISTTPRSIFPRVSIISPSYILPLISQKAQSLLDFFDKLKRAASLRRAFSFLRFKRQKIPHAKRRFVTVAYLRGVMIGL